MDVRTVILKNHIELYDDMFQYALTKGAHFESSCSHKHNNVIKSMAKDFKRLREKNDNQYKEINMDLFDIQVVLILKDVIYLYLNRPEVTSKEISSLTDILSRLDWWIPELLNIGIDEDSSGPFIEILNYSYDKDNHGYKVEKI